MTVEPDRAECQWCGTRPVNLRPPGRLVLIRDTDVRRLRELLRGQVDLDRCPNCGRQVGIAPTVFVLFPADAVVVYAAGTLLDGAASSPESVDWRSRLGRPDAVPHLVRLPDLDALRAEVRRRLGLHPPTLRPLIEAAASGSDLAHLAQNWRRYRPAVLVAAALAIEDGDDALRPVEPAACPPLPAGHDLAPLAAPGTATLQMQLLALEILQLRVWQALCAEWTATVLGDDDGDASFQADLDTYVVGESLVAGAEGALSLLFDDDVPAAVPPYLWRALQAAAARALARPNPAAREWAESYFAHEVACSVRPGGASAGMQAARVSAEFAAATIEHGAAWDAAATHLALLHAGSGDGRLDALGLPRAYEIVHAAAAKAGHPRLVDAVMQSSVVSTLDATASPAEILTDVLTRGAAGEATLVLAGLHLDKQPPERRAASTDVIARGLLAAADDDNRRRVVVWWAARLARDRRFTDTAQVLQDHPVDDGELDVAMRARLWGVHATVLGGAGRWEAAVRTWRRIVALLDDHAADHAADHADVERALRPWARVNLASALAETGSPDEAAALIEDVAFGDGGYGPDPELLARLAQLKVRFGDAERAVELLEAAERLAGPTPAAHRYALQRAQQLVVMRRDAEAVSVLMRTGPRFRKATLQSGGDRNVAFLNHGEQDPDDGEQDPDDRALLAEAACWAMLIARGATLPPGATDRAARMPALLVERAGLARAAGAYADQLALLSRSAEVAQLLGGDARWEHVVAERLGHGTGAEPGELVRAATARWDAGDRPGMREFLSAVPAAMAARYGAVPDIELLVKEPRALLAPLAELAGRVVADEEPAASDVRLVAELQRDAVGRARTARLRDASEEPADLLGDVGARVPPDAGPMVVVEWIRTGEQSLRCLLSRVADGRSDSTWLPLVPVDPKPLQQRLTRRLGSWMAGAPGSPLDTPGWAELADSLVSGLATTARDGDHVVFLHSEVYANLPWHIAIGDRWTVSYAAGWAHLLDVLGRAATPPRRMGICMVPLNREPATNLAALQASALQAVVTGAGAGVEVHRPSPQDCDRAALAELLATVDLAVLLCHGHQLPRSNEIGWVVAHDGALLPAHTVGAADAIGDHLFSWRDCLRLRRAPRTVLSAACASASTYGAGLGDRLGLFSALRHGGTTAMVAPAWDIVATDVLPVLDDVVARYLRGEPLGQALRAACTAAAQTAPDWLAWSLALEGDWR